MPGHKFRLVLCPPPPQIHPLEHEFFHKRILSMVQSFDFSASCNPFGANPDTIEIQIPTSMNSMFQAYAPRIFSGELYFSILAAVDSQNPKLKLDFILEPEHYRESAESPRPPHISRPSLPPPCLSWIPTPAQILMVRDYMAAVKLNPVETPVLERK